MEQAPIVHVVDDDPSIRRAIAALLRSVGIDSVTYESCSEFLDAEIAPVPSCLLLDVRLPGTSGLDFQNQLASHGIDLPVIVITGHGDVPMSVQAMKAGAVDFLTKPFRDQDLLDAVSAAVERHARLLEASGKIHELTRRYETLSTREKQVMELVTAGRLNKQAAFDLGLSEITVKLYRASAMKKMEARTLADLVKMAEKLKIGAAA
ncbi:MAG: response regulator transcription factor [Sphingomonas sp.]|uniref:response regulator transcription factor n=1 Tax=Sphingomonas sp. TaxID=28214 RepID=UPI001B1AC87C|nr:response regulator transcription factor [Sphingomonas sp.]MBO9623362.1 response regulator transcription factor [Sphingomonas sp.]